MEVTGKRTSTSRAQSDEDAFASDWAASCSILVYGVRIGIRTNAPELLDRILEYAPPLWKKASSLRLDRVFTFQLRRKSAGSQNAVHVLLDDGDTPIESDSLKMILEAFQIRLRVYVSEMARRRVFIHAGVVEWQGKAIVVTGRSMSGKTSLVAELVRNGAVYYSDEYAVLDHQGRVYPYPQPLELRREGSRGVQRVLSEEIGGAPGTKALQISLVLVSKFEAGATWRPQQCSAGQAIMELLANAPAARRKPATVIPTLQKALARANVLKGVRGDANTVARTILGGLVVDHCLEKKPTSNSRRRLLHQGYSINCL